MGWLQQYAGTDWYSNNFVDPYMNGQTAVVDVATYLKNFYDAGTVPAYDFAVALTRWKDVVFLSNVE